jgi:hypothetical protein
MSIKLLDCVVLAKDVPEHDLRRGDVGTVVELYGDEAIEVEFISATGETRAVLTMKQADVRKASPTDVLAARQA